MKKAILLIATIFFLSSCQTLKVSGDVTSFTTTATGASVGFKATGEGKYQTLIDSLIKGYPVTYAGQQIQLLHTDTSVTIQGYLNVRYK